MKIQSLLMLAVLHVALTQCTKDEKVPVAPDNRMIATVDGINWISGPAPVVAFANGSLFISAVGSKATRIIILLRGQRSGMGTFDVAGTDGSVIPENYVAYVLNTSAVNPLHLSSNLQAAVVGQVTITSDGANQTISGTFSSQVKQLIPPESIIQIKDGSFTKIKYVLAEVRGNPGSFSSTASAKIIGIDLSPFYIVGESSGDRLSLEFIGINTSIFISIPNTITTGSYSLGYSSSPYYALFHQIGLPGHFAGSQGNLVISNHDTAGKIITGTFTFDQRITVGNNGLSYSVTDGEFVVTYH